MKLTNLLTFHSFTRFISMCFLKKISPNTGTADSLCLDVLEGVNSMSRNNRNHDDNEKRFDMYIQHFFLDI